MSESDKRIASYHRYLAAANAALERARSSETAKAWVHARTAHLRAARAASRAELLDHSAFHEHYAAGILRHLSEMRKAKRDIRRITG